MSVDDKKHSTSKKLIVRRTGQLLDREFSIYRKLLREKHSRTFELFDPNVTDSKNNSGLIYAVPDASRSSDFSLIDFLCAGKADINQKSSDDITPLYKAIKFKPANLSLIKYLVTKRADINTCGSYGSLLIETALGTALGTDLGTTLATAHSIELKKVFFYLLEQKKIDVNTKDERGCSALYMSAQYGIPEYVDALIKVKAEIDNKTNQGGTPLMASVEMALIKSSDRHLPVIDKLLDSKADPNVQYNVGSGVCASLYYVASCSKPNFNIDLKIAEKLLAAKADPNQFYNRNQTVLGVACQTKKPRLIELLLIKKADVNQKNLDIQTPILLLEVQKKSNDKIVNILLKHKADPNGYENSTHQSVLVTATFAKNFKVVKRLVTANADLNFRRKDNNATALHAAALMGHLEIVSFFVKLKADIDAQMKDGETPLFLAAQEGNHSIVKFLLDNKADPSISRHDKATPVFIAYKEGHAVNFFMILQRLLGLRKQLDDSNNSEAADQKTEKNTKRKTTASSNQKIWISKDAKKCISVSRGSANPEIKSGQSIVPEQHDSAYFFQPQTSTSARRMLLDQGFTPDQISKMQNELKRKEEKKQPSNFGNSKHAQCVTTWFGGKISSRMSCVKLLESLTKTPNCFFYMNKRGLAAQGCDLSLFTGVVPKFCARENEQGIKCITGVNHIVQVDIGDSVEKMKITHELKIINRKERILCFQRLSDNGKSTLIVGCIFAPKGLHTSASANSFWQSNKIRVLYFPAPPQLLNNDQIKFLMSEFR